MGMGEPPPRVRGGRKPSAAMRALRGARDLYVRGIRGLDRLLAAANPRRTGVGRPTSRVFGGVGSRHSEENLRDLMRSMQARRGAAPSAVASIGSGRSKEDTASCASAPPVKRCGAIPLERINEDDAAVVHPTS